MGKYNDGDDFIEEYEDMGKRVISSPFEKVIEEIIALRLKKGLDYGSATDSFANLRGAKAFGIPPWLGTVLRANDKIARLQSYARRGHLANESVRDSLVDLAVYAIIAVMLYDEEGK